MDRRAMSLAFCTIYLLEKETKDKITFYWDNHLLEVAFNKIVKAKHFPEWFCRDFCYDPLYAHSETLRRLFSEALQYGLLEHVFYAGGIRIQLAFGERVYREMLKELDVAEPIVKEWASTLETLLALYKEQLLAREGTNSR